MAVLVDPRLPRYRHGRGQAYSAFLRLVHNEKDMAATIYYLPHLNIEGVIGSDLMR
jgi:hypothetical protein